MNWSRLSRPPSRQRRRASSTPSLAERQNGPPLPRPGAVVHYAYLWAREADTGAEEGRKDRPCAVVLAVTGAGGAAQVVVVPITSQPPAQPDDAVEMPAGTRQRLGLQDAPCWIVVTEVNRFA